MSNASRVSGAQLCLGRGGIQRSSSKGGSANGTPSHMRYFSPAIPRNGPAVVCISAGSEPLFPTVGHTPDAGHSMPDTGQISGGEACGLHGIDGGARGDGAAARRGQRRHRAEPGAGRDGRAASGTRHQDRSYAGAFLPGLSQNVWLRAPSASVCSSRTCAYGTARCALARSVATVKTYFCPDVWRTVPAWARSGGAAGAGAGAEAQGMARRVSWDWTFLATAQHAKVVW